MGRAAGTGQTGTFPEPFTSPNLDTKLRIAPKPRLSLNEPPCDPLTLYSFVVVGLHLELGLRVMYEK